MEIGDIFKKYYSKLCWYAASICGNEEESKDIAINSILKYWEKYSSKEDIQCQSILYAIVRNSIISDIRKNKVANKHIERWHKIIPDFVEPNNINIKEELFCVLHNQITILPNNLKKCFELRLYGLKTEEIGQRLNIPPSTVRGNLRNGYRILRQNNNIIEAYEQ